MDAQLNIATDSLGQWICQVVLPQEFCDLFVATTAPLVGDEVLCSGWGILTREGREKCFCRHSRATAEGLRESLRAQLRAACTLLRRWEVDRELFPLKTDMEGGEF